MGGEETSIEEFPFMAGLERWHWFECGATVVREYWVLTAAHCVRGNEEPGEIMLRVGSSDRESGGYVVPVDEFVTYPSRMPFDIALLHAKMEFPSGPKMKPVALTYYYLVGTHSGSVVGWGKQSGYEDSPKRMRKTTLVLLDPSECKYAVDFDWEALVDTFYCARPKTSDNDVCQGDSGGPFLKDNFQHGIVSRGQCSGSLQGRIVLTNVYYFRDWIKSVVDQ